MDANHQGAVRAQSTIEGVLERIVYFNAASNFTVAKLQVARNPELVTVVGSMPSPNPGETLRLQGEWTVDAKFGRQFRVASCLSVLPATVTGIEKYLGSGLVKGIGPVMAKRIVDMFALETLDIIEAVPDRLLEVEGIGRVRAERISKAWQEQKEVREVMVFLQGHGVSSTYAVKIYKAYGDKSVSVVRENPYRLALDISGIGFKTADRIARNLGVDPASQFRAEAGILHTLNELVGEGHIYYPRDKLIDAAASLLEVECAVAETALASLVDQRLVVVDDQPDERAVYLTPLYVAEVNTARRLKTLVQVTRELTRLDVAQSIDWVQHTTRIELAALQKEAIRQVLSSKVLVLTGGPGTGKTTLINCIIRILEQQGQRILLAAPTGRAARRMTEVTGRDARTIHRLLEYSPSEGGFKRNEERPLEADVVIVDETSMVDILLMNHLLKAVPPAATLLLVGDIDQLPSVGPGNVLKDVIASGSVETVKLTEVFRQAQESMIVVNAHRVNRGEFPIVRFLEGTRSDFYWVDREEPEQALEAVKDLCTSRLPRAFGLNPLDDIQVMSPMHKGLVGVASLNTELQQLFNPAGAEVSRGGRCFRINDKVMQTVNNYEKDVFNGDIGRVVAIDADEQSLRVRYEDRTVDYEWSELDDLVLAYAISIHKSQGSEYPAVVVPLLTQHYVMLQRNLLYTAITRARKLVVLVGSKRAIAVAARNSRVQHRYTALAARLAPAP